MIVTRFDLTRRLSRFRIGLFEQQQKFWALKSTTSHEGPRQRNIVWVSYSDYDVIISITS